MFKRFVFLFSPVAMPLTGTGRRPLERDDKKVESRRSVQLGRMFDNRNPDAIQFEVHFVCEEKDAVGTTCHHRRRRR